MRKPVATLPSVEEMPNEPKMPRVTGRYRNTPVGGKMGSAGDDMAAGTQIKVPGQTPDFFNEGHVKTAIPSVHVFGQRSQGARDNDGYKMHTNPADASRSSNLQGDVKVAVSKIPKQPRLKTPKV